MGSSQYALGASLSRVRFTHTGSARVGRKHMHGTPSIQMVVSPSPGAELAPIARQNSARTRERQLCCRSSSYTPMRYCANLDPYPKPESSIHTISTLRKSQGPRLGCRFSDPANLRARSEQTSKRLDQDLRPPLIVVHTAFLLRKFIDLDDTESTLDEPVLGPGGEHE